MDTTTCMCGLELSAEGLEALALAAKTHFDEVHPGFGVNLTMVTDLLNAERRLSTDTERLDEIGQVEVHQATPERLADLQHFFDYDAFAGNAPWAACYCMFHHWGGNESAEWPNRSFEQNRADMSERIDRGTTNALLAYVDGKVVGWCNASPRSTMPAHVGTDELADDSVGAIVCFVVAPPYRRHGVSERLLREAVTMLSENGFASAEGSPVAEPRDEASAYKGTPELFARAGFEPVGDGSTMRKQL